MIQTHGSYLLLLVGLCMGHLGVASPISASMTTTVRLSVMASTMSLALSDLNLSDVEPGADAQTIGPEDSQAALFEVYGDKDQAFLLSFPTKALLKRLSDEKNEAIEVSDFTPSSSFRTGKLPDGLLRGSFGATRKRLNSRLKPGPYVGKLVVTVVF